MRCKNFSAAGGKAENQEKRLPPEKSGNAFEGEKMDEVRQATSKEKKTDETKQLDRRARKTRKAIQNALMQLSVDKRINEITVTDVTQVADINRSTFYLHYNSVYEVLADIEQSSTDTMLEIVNKYDPVQLPLNPYPLLKALTEEADANPAFMRFVSDSKISTTFLPKLKKCFIDRLVARVMSKFPDSDENFLKVTVTFMTGGVMDVYVAWLRSEDPMPLEDLCKYTATIVSQGYANIISSIVG